MNDVSRLPLESADPTDNIAHLQMLLDLSRQVAALDTLDAVLEKLVTVAVEQTGAERGSLFLNDEKSGELYSRIANGVRSRGIRFPNTEGIAGHVYQTGTPDSITNAYSDDRFNAEIDRKTGFTTRSILCVPLRDTKRRIIGVVQLLNKIAGEFDERDQGVAEGITAQCAIALDAMTMVERLETRQAREMEFLDIVADMTSDLDLTRLLKKVMTQASGMLDAERSTLFLNDDKTGELFSHVGEGLNTSEIRLPNHLGIAGTVFTSGETVNIPHAYADLRFNPSFDKQTGFFTRSILCVPVVNKAGKVIGVTQALNKRGGPFSDEDESRLKAFTAQISIGLENAKLFDDVQSMQNYNESMLQSMSNGVLTFNTEGIGQTCNHAAIGILRCMEDEVIGTPVRDLMGTANAWLSERVEAVEASRVGDVSVDRELKFDTHTVSANVSVLPLNSGDGTSLGTMVMIEDISTEKRVKSTMSRYMDPELADQLLSEGAEQELLGGREVEATVLFTDIRSFTTLSETLGPQGTVAFLNDYFERMVDCLTDHGGVLDKFIGDAIMAGFGVPVSTGDDEDRALRAAIDMLTRLRAWNDDRVAAGQMPVEMGIGVNTDSVVSGNIGSPKRMDYTMIGDGVNLAARLESACKQYGARILLSDFTRNKLKGVYRMREVDTVVVKGKTQPVAVWESLDYHCHESFPNLSDVLGYFEEGVRLYRGQDWVRATAQFEKALAANPDDWVSTMYVRRCEALAAKPPGDGWDGVWTLSDK
ncbi:MAG: GAF domain-containing protein [Pseudomonadota bacterium]